ncbi:class I SAM-dependent methyltransferase [Bdellovibrionota bacterium FG-1]
MLLWHQELPKKYGVIEKFNHGFPASLPIKPNWKTLEIGAGIGEHCRYENLDAQEYHCLEYREEFCKEIRKILPPTRVHCGDIHQRQCWDDGYFDRIVAIHVLEHLRDLPNAIQEIHRLLKPNGVLDIVIPCEGGLAHTLARKISAERLFVSNFNMDFTPIHLNEHVNSYGEVLHELTQHLFPVQRHFFPLRVPFPNINLAVGMRLQNNALRT